MTNEPNMGVQVFLCERLFFGGCPFGTHHDQINFRFLLPNLKGVEDDLKVLVPSSFAYIQKKRLLPPLGK